MGTSIKLGSDTYLDASGVVVNATGETLSFMQGAATVDSTKANGSIAVYRFGRIGIFVFNISLVSGIGTAQQVATFSGITPLTTFYFNFAPATGKQGFLQIGNDGKILVGAQSSDTVSGWVRGVYIVPTT